MVQTLKTAVVKDNCHPEWNEELTLAIKDVNTPIHLVSTQTPTPTFFKLQKNLFQNRK